MDDSDGSYSCKDISQEHPSEEHDYSGSQRDKRRPATESILPLWSILSVHLWPFLILIEASKEVNYRNKSINLTFLYFPVLFTFKERIWKVEQWLKNF